MLCVNQKGQGEPIVFLHGWAYDHRVWQACVEDLSTDHQTLCIDLPGYGGSSYIPSSSYLSLTVDELSRVINEEVTLIAWSLGGLIALCFAQQFPQRVKQLILFATNPFFIGNHSWPGITNHQAQRFYQTFLNDNTIALQQFCLWQGNKTLAKRLEREFSVNQPEIISLSASLDCLFKTDIRAVLSDIMCPQYYFFAQLDPIVPSSVIKNLLVIKPELQYSLIKGARHAPFLSHSQQCIALIRSYLKLRNRHSVA